MDENDAQVEAASKLPVPQYAVAFIFGGMAVWAILRSSRRGWSE
ncbi:MAG: hypothetical protein ACRDD1_16275 [Planctomycetia bacterium]